MGRAPGAGLMRALEGRAEEVAGTLCARDVATMLWAVSVFSILRTPDGEIRLVHTMVQRLVSLGKAAACNAASLSQLHQFFVSCIVEPRFRVEAINDLQSLQEKCRGAFQGERLTPSVTQQQVSGMLRQMGYSVEDEFFCPRSGYSIDMLVKDSALGIGGERRSKGGVWAVEFDGPSHFHASGVPKGSTLLKRRHLALLGHAVVSVTWWEWDECKGVVEREQYLRGKLEGKDSFDATTPLQALSKVHVRRLASQHLSGQPMSSNIKSDVTAPPQALPSAAVSSSDTIKLSRASSARTGSDAAHVASAHVASVHVGSAGSPSVPMVCEECDEDAEATHSCEECSVLLCDDCTKHHRKSKKTKHHALLTVAELKARMHPC